MPSGLTDVESRPTTADVSGTPSFVLTSVPKAGTHLLSRAVRLLHGCDKGKVLEDLLWERDLRFKDVLTGAYKLMRACYQSAMKVCGHADASAPPVIPYGSGQVEFVPVEDFRNALEELGKGEYIYGHLPFSGEAKQLLLEMNMLSVFILRDPRDIVVSHADHMRNRNPDGTLHAYSKSRSPAESLLDSICGIDSPDANLRNIRERITPFLGWMGERSNYTTYFEKLVGTKGGGSAEEQMKELSNIAQHLDIPHDEQGLARVVEKLFGKSATFREGKIGSWKASFHDEHKRAFKSIAGDLLIDLGYEKDFDW